MLHYSVVGTNDVLKSRQFYVAVLASINLVPIFEDERETVFGPPNSLLGQAQFVVMMPFDGQTARPGNGTTTGFRADSTAKVDEVHAAAIAAGGTCDGPPGTRDYADNVYIGYFRDTDGNKISIVYFSPTPLALKAKALSHES